jgi:hypothetical protein
VRYYGGRRSLTPAAFRVETWHRWPKDDDWKRCTLEHYQSLGMGLKPGCKACQHHGEIISPIEFAERFNVPMDTPLLVIERAMRCTACGCPAGYLGLDNPATSRMTGGYREGWMK